MEGHIFRTQNIEYCFKSRRSTSLSLLITPSMLKAATLALLLALSSQCFFKRRVVSCAPAPPPPPPPKPTPKPCPPVVVPPVVVPPTPVVPSPCYPTPVPKPIPGPNDLCVGKKDSCHKECLTKGFEEDDADFEKRMKRLERLRDFKVDFDKDSGSCSKSSLGVTGGKWNSCERCQSINMA